MRNGDRLSRGETGARITAIVAASACILVTLCSIVQPSQFVKAQEHNSSKREAKKDEESCRITADPTAPFPYRVICGSTEIVIKQEPNSPKHEAYETCIDDSLNAIWRFVRTWWSDPGYVFASAVAIFTLFLWKATSGLWSTAQEQLRDLKRSIEAADRSAKAAETSADALPTLERAQVFLVVYTTTFSDVLPDVITRAKSEDATASTKDATVIFWFVNYGKTPAIVKEISRRVSHWPDLPNQLCYTPNERIAGDLVIPSGAPFPSYITVAPANGLRATNEVPITSADVEDINKGNSFLFFYGRIVYDDVFGKEHITPYCWRYESITNEFRPYGPKEYNQRT